MYRCSYNVGCLSASVHRVGKGLSASVHRVGKGLSASVHRVGKGLIVNCSIVCTVGRAYLYVDPNVLWLTPEMLSDATFDITSNVSWNID